MEKTILNRERVRNKMAQALSEDIKCLSSGMQSILIDDLATAFESRLLVLKNAESQNKINPMQTYIECELEIANIVQTHSVPQKIPAH